MSGGPIRFRARLLCNDPRLGLYFRVPAEFILRWGITGTSTVEGTINGHPIGRRAIKDSGPKTSDWYMGLSKPLAEAIGAEEGYQINVALHLADMTMPQSWPSGSRTIYDYARAWEALSPNHRRKAIEHYLEAKTPMSHTARLEKIARSIKARL